jgi:CheY-like chemotaxis protein/GGDEF domain-containing protein
MGEALSTALASLLVSSPANGWIFFIRADQIEYINTVYGRDEGDTTFRRIGEILAAAAPLQLYRHAGPVFAAMLTGNTAQALETAERFRKSVAESTELVEPFSVSVALLSTDEVDDREEVFSLGVSRLTNARRRGGNTVSAVSHAEEEDAYSSGTVIVIDPEIEMLTVLIREIESRGLTVMTTTDGLEALQMVSQFTPDVIVSEINVPKIGGFELRAKLREFEELGDIPYVILSHRQNDDLIREAAALQIVHYHKKPVSALLIAELVTNLAATRHHRETFA